MSLSRRTLLSGAGALAGAAVASTGGCSPAATSNGPHSGPIQKISEVANPLAITMVDYSWLLKHHRYGAYEDYDQFMSELVERGYNAVRMDCFPHLIAPDENGVVQESFWHKKPDRAPMIWGNDYSIQSTPRKSLIEFLTKCREYGVHAGLATWFIHHGTDRSARFRSEDDFVRAWDETLTFIRDNGLLDVVTYVDVLNEYPLAHGLTWLDEEIDERGEEALFQANNPDENVPPDMFESRGWFNDLQTRYYQTFMTNSIRRLKARWPGLDIFTSETGQDVPQDYSPFDAIDKHFWFIHNEDLVKGTGFKRLMWKKETDVTFHETYYAGLEHWDAHKADYATWMEGRISRLAAIGRDHGVPVGNTEGWGAVFWNDHPNVDWRFIREAAEITVPLAVKHGYKFICTSNFTCPQFKGMWEDVGWHQALTSVIKAG